MFTTEKSQVWSTVSFGKFDGKLAFNRNRQTHTHTQFNKKEKKKRTGKCYVQCRESGNRRANVQQPIGE